MGITERQTEILNRLIEEYIVSARPVSSQHLQEKHDFGLRPASIRLEMQKLTDAGFLTQPHTSAGRVPTDKGYRFFVDELLEDEPDDSEMGDWLVEERDSIRFLQSLTKKLAEAADALVLSYLEKEKIFWKEGWEEVLRKPEFDEHNYAINFAEFLENFEEHIGDIKVNSEIKIYIGRENPFKKARDFSVILSRCELGDEEGIISLLGPKRMDYDKNISLIKSLSENLESRI